MLIAPIAALIIFAFCDYGLRIEPNAKAEYEAKKSEKTIEENNVTENSK